MATTPEIQGVVDRYSQHRLFESDDAPRLRTPQGATAIGPLQPLPEVLKRPPVVEWLLSSKDDGTGSERMPSPPSESPPTTNGGDRRKVPTASDSEANSARAYDVTARLLDALEAAHRVVGHDYGSSSHPSALSSALQPAVSAGGASGHPTKAAEHEARAAQSRGHSGGGPSRRPPDRADTPIGEATPGTPSAASTPVRRDDQRFPEHPPLPLSSSSFARLGVLPPRTGSSESLDNAGQPREFDMEAVRRALQVGAANDDGKANSPRPTPYGGRSSGLPTAPRRSPHQAKYVNPFQGHHRSMASSEVASFIQDDQRPSGVAAVAPELGEEDRELLQRGFSDLTKRRSACDMRNVKGRLFDAPLSRRKR